MVVLFGMLELLFCLVLFFAEQEEWFSLDLAFVLVWFELFWLATAHSVMIMTLDWLKVCRLVWEAGLRSVWENWLGRSTVAV